MSEHQDATMGRGECVRPGTAANAIQHKIELFLLVNRYDECLKFIEEEISRSSPDEYLIQTYQHVIRERQHDTRALYLRLVSEVDCSVHSNPSLAQQLLATPDRLEQFVKSDDYIRYLQLLADAKSASGVVFVLEQWKSEACVVKAITSLIEADSLILPNLIKARSILTISLTRPEFWTSQCKREEIAESTCQLLLSELLCDVKGCSNSEALGDIYKILVSLPSSLNVFQTSLNNNTLWKILNFSGLKGDNVCRTIGTKILLLWFHSGAQEDAIRQYCLQCVTENLSKGTIFDVALAFTITETLFLLRPAIAVDIFNLDGFIEEALAESEEHGAPISLAVVDLFAAAASDPKSRACLLEKGMSFLKQLVDQGESEQVKIGALATLAKLAAATNLFDDQSLTLLSQSLLSLLPNKAVAPRVLEGLLFLSLKPSMKYEIANSNFVRDVEASLTNNADREIMHNVAAILRNLTRYPEEKSVQERAIDRIRTFNQNDSCESQVIETPASISKVIDTLVQKQVINLLPLLSVMPSIETKTLLCHTINSIATARQHRSVLARAGQVRFLCDYAAHSKSSGAHSDTHPATEALAKILISVDPNLIFNETTLPVSNSLLPLLLMVISEAENKLPIFEGLLALTNLASMNEEVCEYILRYWTSIETLLLDENMRIRRAATELVCNLAQCELTVAKFSEQTPESRRRIDTLLALADADDRATRIAAFGALAAITDADTCCRQLEKLPAFLQLIMQAAEASDQEVQLRALVCLRNATAFSASAYKDNPRYKQCSAVICALAKSLPACKATEVASDIVLLLGSQGS